MLTKEQLAEMFDLQEKLEIRISGKDWKKEGHNYPLCIFMECTEIIDHCGWKHWKDIDKPVDYDAIAMEVVDIWHFGMAFMLAHPKFNLDQIYEAIVDANEELANQPDRTLIDLCLGLSFAPYATNTFPLGNFIALMDSIDMDFDKLYTLYVSKNILNWFRQDHGYKTGKYNKVWHGREDNEHLYEICAELGDELTAERLRNALEFRYTGQMTIEV